MKLRTLILLLVCICLISQTYQISKLFKSNKGKPKARRTQTSTTATSSSSSESTSSSSSSPETEEKKDRILEGGLDIRKQNDVVNNSPKLSSKDKKTELQSVLKK